MNVVEPQLPPGGFAGRLEAELVKVVAARSAPPQHPRQRVAAAMRRSAVRTSVLAVGAAGAVAVGFAVGGPSVGGPSLGHGQAAPVHIRTAAFSVDTYADGTVHLTWDKRQYIQFSRNIAGLQQALRQAGLPVLVKEGVFCKGPHDSGYLDPSGVGPGVGQVMKGVDGPGGAVDFVFTPTAMPAGHELFIGYLSPSQLAITHGRPGSVERLVPTGVPLTCTTQAPLPHYGQSQPVEQPG